MKWQWYRIQLILYMALSLGTIILFTFIQTTVNKGGVELVTMILNIFLSLCLFFNGFINYLWLHLYYPDQLPSKAFRRTTTIFIILAVPTILLYAFFAISGLYSFIEAKLSLVGRNLVWFAGTLLLLTLSLVGAVNFILHFQLVRAIKRNRKNAFQDFMQ